MATKTRRRDPGDGALYFDGRLWRASVSLGYGEDGRRRRKGVSSVDKATAARKLRDLRRQVEDAGGDLPTASMTLEKWLTTWLGRGSRRKPSTQAGYRSAVTQHLTPILGRRRLDKLAPQHVHDLHRELQRRGLAPSSILKTHRVLAKALTDAQREGLVHRNVTEMVDAPRKGTVPVAVLTAEQARALLAATVHDPMGPRWACAFLLGARQGEVLGMEWEQVDLDAGVLDLAWQLQRLGWRHGCGDTCGRTRAGWCPQRAVDVPHGFECRDTGHGLFWTRPKTSRARLVPLPDPLVAFLRLQHARTGPSGLVFTCDGRPIDHRRDHDAWKAALAKAGLPDVHLHSARHTTATLLMDAGVPDRVIADILGHSQVVTTHGYQRGDLEMRRRALSGLGRELLGG